MGLNQKAALAAASEYFPGREILEVGRLGRGLIHETWSCLVAEGGRPRRYALQRLNTDVFPEPAKVAENVGRVTDHIRQKIASSEGEAREERTLELVRDGSGEILHRDRSGSLWRAYLYLEGTETHEEIESLSHATEAAAAFARFQSHLADLPGPALHETIVGFHDTAARLERFREALRRDVLSRSDDCREEIACLLNLASLSTRLHSSSGRPHIVHNDTKINNVLFRQGEAFAVAVIDLDTVMPGLPAHDFGDLVRSSMAGFADVEPEARRAEVDLTLVRALSEGFLAEASAYLSGDERRQLIDAPSVMTFELALRFLTDYLEGDIYFGPSHPGINLDRARFQVALLLEFEAAREDLESIVEGLILAYP